MISKSSQKASDSNNYRYFSLTTLAQKPVRGIRNLNSCKKKNDKPCKKFRLFLIEIARIQMQFIRVPANKVFCKQQLTTQCFFETTISLYQSVQNSRNTL